MKASEAKRALTEAGWRFERYAQGSHELWRGPDGQWTTVQRRTDRNQRAFIRRLQRNIGTTAATAAPPKPKSEETVMRFYVGHDKTNNRIITEIYLGKTEIELLGGEKQPLTLKDLGDGRFAIEPDSKGTLHARPKGNRWRIRTKDLTGVPVTGVTTLPHSVNGNGFVLRPFEADFRAPGRYTAKATPVRVCRDEDVSESVETTASMRSDTGFEQPRNGYSLDDLREALGILREAARDLDAELYVGDDGELHARIEL